MDRRLEKAGTGTFFRTAADLALPRVCIVCGRELMPSERHLCLECLSDLPETFFSLMRRNPMADSLNEKIEAHRCRQGLEDYEEYALATALFYYRSGSGYERISQELKYHRNFQAGRFFSRMLGSRLSASELYDDVDAVIPVPLHWTRRWKRGYNQAEVIAREVASTLGVRCLSDALERRRRTKTQTRLGRDAKAANVAGAFVLNPHLSGRNLQRLKAARHILLVDDVFTTGATLSECHIALRSALGPSVSISVASLAFVG